MDIATDEDPIWPRTTNLKATGWGWVDFTRAANAVTLFGSGFGHLFSPMASSACAGCRYNTEAPKGHAVCVPEIQDIIQRRGDKTVTPWRLADEIYWHAPDKTFEPCQCTKFSSAKHGRVQVLLPSSFPKLFGRS